MIPFQDMFSTTMVAAIASFSASVMIVLTQRWHGKNSLDSDLGGVQKFHKKPVPRIGGIALLIGVLAILLDGALDYPYLMQQEDSGDVFKLLLAGMPAFVAGLAEDLTKRVSVRVRLAATFASGLLAYWLLGAYLPRIDVWGLDSVFQWMPFAIIVTAVAVAGVANSINIIDGFHGVAGSAVMIILAGLGFLAWQAGDGFVAKLALIGIGAMLGFLFVNYPTGRLFMGDGGAYLFGFWVAEVAVLLVMRNPAINAWQVLAICAYPVIEVMYSIYRKKVIRKMSPGIPDRLHLHMLIYRRLVWRVLPHNDMYPWVRNAAVAWVIATWIAVMTWIAVKFGNTVSTALVVVGANILLYLAVYVRLIRGRWQLLNLPAETQLGSSTKLSMRKSQ